MIDILGSLGGMVAGTLATYWYLRPRLRPHHSSSKPAQPPSSAVAQQEPEFPAVDIFNPTVPADRPLTITHARRLLAHFSADDTASLFAIVVEEDGMTHIVASADLRGRLAAIEGQVDGLERLHPEYARCADRIRHALRAPHQ